MTRRIGAVAAVGALWLCDGAGPGLAARANDTAEVRAVRTFFSRSTTRLVIDCSDRVRHRLEHAAGTPPRIALDLPGADLPPGGFKPLSIEGGPAARVQALRTARGVRILIDTRDDAFASVFALPDPYRLVIDIGTRPSIAAGAVPSAAPRPGQTTEAGPSRGTGGREGADRPPSGDPAAPDRQHGMRAGGERRSRPPATEDARHATGAKRPVTSDERRATSDALRPTSPRYTVVIDPGHGGHDPGARGVGGLWEKDVTLAIARRLAVKMRAAGELDVVLTRDRDVYLALEERTAFANAHNADLFVSIHANASPNPGLAGMETYYLNNTADRGTLRLARMENGFAAATGRRADGTDVAFILSSLVQSYKIDESVDLAHDLQEATVAHVRRDFDSLRSLGVKQGPFYVLVGAAMPSVLVEVSFLTHPEEGALLADAEYQEALAEGLLRGLHRFVENRRRMETL